MAAPVLANSPADVEELKMREFLSRIDVQLLVHLKAIKTTLTVKCLVLKHEPRLKRQFDATERKLATLQAEIVRLHKRVGLKSQALM